jgi:hypothetical protein
METLKVKSNTIASSHTVHDGKFFAAEYFAKHDWRPSLVSTLLLDLNDDLLSVMAESLLNQGHLAALLVARCTCIRLQNIADEALKKVSAADLAKALYTNELPVESVCPAAARAGMAFRSGDLPKEVALDLVRWANEELRKPGAPMWEVSSVVDGDDPNRDCAVVLRGIDEATAAKALSSDQTTPLSHWYAENLPGFPLQELHLPCLIVGPSRLQSRALSSKDRRKSKRVPMELYRVARVQVSCYENHALASFLSALLVGYNQRDYSTLYTP